MTLKQLEYVITVAKIGSISKAANILYIAQPSLTHAIMELEKEMNITIFTRTNKGISITNEGETFLSYARAVLDQSNLLLEKYSKDNVRKTIFSVSCQHYSFCVLAFSNIIKKYGKESYDFTLRETQTHEIIDDVTSFKSELGILYLSDNNRDVLEVLIKKNDLEFIPLFNAEPHVFIANTHPLANKEIITLEDLKDYPYITYEQGEYNSFYFSEEFMPNFDINKNIIVRDRATLFNLAVSLNGYTVSSGIILKDVNASCIISKPFKYNSSMEIGYIKRKNTALSKYALSYIEFIKEQI